MGVQGCATTTLNLPKGSLSVTKWAKNGVFEGGLKGLIFRKSTFGVQKGHIWGPSPPQNWSWLQACMPTITNKPIQPNQLTADNDTALPTGKPLISVSISSASWLCICSRCSFSSSISCWVAGACLQDSSIQWDNWSIWAYGCRFIWVLMMKKMKMESG